MTLHQRTRRGRGGSRPRGLTYIDVIVLLLCVGLGILVGCYTGCRSRETANRVKCASNLRQIGQALLLYSNDYNGAYPRVAYVGGADPKPVWGTDGQPNDVSATLFLLLKTQDITAEVFICPSSNAEKDDYGGGNNRPLDRLNFSGVKKNLSYSLHNPYVKDGLVPAGDQTYWTAGMGAEFAVAADINPGTGGGDNVLAPTAKSSAKEMKPANTNNHDKDGQNILYGDGHVAWESNPFVGIDRDNIYTTRDGRLLASPADASDSVLLPADD